MPRHPAAPANRLRGTLESTLESTLYFPTKSTLPFGPSVAFVSLGSSVAFVPKFVSLSMFPSSPRTEASGKRGGHPSNRAPPTPDAPESIAVPADALEQSRNPSSTTSNDGGTAVQDNGPPDAPANEALELPPDTVDVASACLEHIKNILQAIHCAGAPHGGRDVFCLVKNILEHYSVNTLDEDTEPDDAG